MSKYSDVKKDIELMLDSIIELSSLENIINWLEEDDSDVYTPASSFSEDTIEQTIQYFENVLVSPRPNNEREIGQQFVSFFKWLQNSQEITIDNPQIERLHNLVTLYADLTGYSSLSYRRLLLNIVKEHNKELRGITGIRVGYLNV